MKKDIQKEIEIPEGVEVRIDGTTIHVKGKEGETNRAFKTASIKFLKKDNLIVLENKKATKTEKKLMHTFAAHIANMIKGVQEKFKYKLKICFNHFPMTAEIKGKEVIIKNFLGEKVPRKAKILEDVEVNINGTNITVISNQLEKAGQVAANLERATLIRKRDRRVFQDGIFMTHKPGREI